MKICALLLPIILLFSIDRQGVVKRAFVTKLPGEIPESSGLIVENANQFWTINDSGNPAELLAFDSSGKLLIQNRVWTAKNKDWESLAHKGDTIFIGDFGNNRNNRQDLRVFVSSRKGKVYYTVPFQYPDQQNFPPPHSNMNFDAEGSFYLKGAIYIFSKTRIPNSGYSKVYRLPANPVNQEIEAKLLDSLNIGTMVTGAAISPDKATVLLMSYGKIYKLTDFTSKSFDQAKLQDVSIPVSQTEAIGFLNNEFFYFTNEQGRLFRMNLSVFN